MWKIPFSLRDLEHSEYIHHVIKPGLHSGRITRNCHRQFPFVYFTTLRSYRSSTRVGKGILDLRYDTIWVIWLTEVRTSTNIKRQLTLLEETPEAIARHQTHMISDITHSAQNGIPHWYNLIWWIVLDWNGPLTRYVKLRVRMRRECRESFPRHHG